VWNDDNSNSNSNSNSSSSSSNDNAHMGLTDSLPPTWRRPLLTPCVTMTMGKKKKTPQTCSISVSNQFIVYNIGRDEKIKKKMTTKKFFLKK
jgi:hypothetical protein